MTTELLLEVIGEADSRYVEEAMTPPARKNKGAYIKAAVTAACICLFAFSLPLIAKSDAFNSLIKYFRIEENGEYLNNETGYRICAEVKKFQTDEFSEDIQGLKDDIIRDYKNHSLFSSRTPGCLYKRFETYQSARQYIGLAEFNTPEIFSNTDTVTVTVTGEPDGDITEIYFDSFSKTENTNLQIVARIYTEHSKHDDADILHILNEETDHTASYETTDTGLEYIKTEITQNSNKYKGIQGHFVHNGILYMVNVAYKGSPEAAEELFTNTLNAFCE